ncbi:hypothetical protein TNCV_3390131 [Trichonephila clavipes]|nr:hypothetical protein TNCV_3390131 [Trichonephila clavipes]
MQILYASKPPVQILHVSESVQIPDVTEHAQIPVSQVPQPPMQILPEPMQIYMYQNLCRFQMFQNLCRFQMFQNLCRFQCHKSHSHLCRFQCHKSHSHLCRFQCQVPQPPMQLLPELDTLNPLESTDAFDQLMSFVFGPQELQLLHTVHSIFDGDLFSFLDEFESAPMDLTMPRLNSCVKKSIGIKPIQPMNLSVNSSIGQ